MPKILCTFAAKLQGTIIFMELGTAKEIDPENVVEHRTKASDEYNEMFIDSDELTELW